MDNSAGGKRHKVKYTLVDLVDNINTDVKSEVADQFDFGVSSKDQIVVYYEQKVTQIREEHHLQIKELKEQTSRAISDLRNRLEEQEVEVKAAKQAPPIDLAQIQEEIKKAQMSIQVEQS